MEYVYEYYIIENYNYGDEIKDEINQNWLHVKTKDLMRWK